MIFSNKFKKICVWAITPGGISHGETLSAHFEQADFFVSQHLSHLCSHPEDAQPFENLSEMLARQFKQYSGHVFIFSTGIAVRIIAPLLKSKLEDPAVVVLDDRARHAISLVSGHLGGANELASAVAEIIGAIPVITTATDVNQLPAIDIISKEKNLVIENPEQIKTINMAFLQNQVVTIIDPYALITDRIPERLRTVIQGKTENQTPSVMCTDVITTVSRGTLLLRPLSLVVGIGCNRGTAAKEMLGFLKSVFNENALSLNSINGFATTQLKNDEKGLLDMARELGHPIKFYSRERLNSVENILNPSKMVEKHIGVKSVCEAAAILASNNGDLIVPKMKKGNVTVAVARKHSDFL